MFFNIIFWILATITIFITINAIEFFDLRYYHFLALFIGFLLWISALALFADEISFTCKAPSTVVSGQQFKLVYTVNKREQSGTQRY